MSVFTVRMVAFTKVAVMGRLYAVLCAVNLDPAAAIVAWKVVALRRGMYSHDHTRSTSCPAVVLHLPTLCTQGLNSCPHVERVEDEGTNNSNSSNNNNNTGNHSRMRLRVKRSRWVTQRFVNLHLCAYEF